MRMPQGLDEIGKALWAYKAGVIGTGEFYCWFFASITEENAQRSLDRAADVDYAVVAIKRGLEMKFKPDSDTARGAQIIREML